MEGEKRRVLKLTHRAKFYIRNKYYKVLTSTVYFGNKLARTKQKVNIPKDILSKWSRHNYKNGIAIDKKILSVIKNKKYLKEYEEARRRLEFGIHDFHKYTIEEKKAFLNKYKNTLRKYPLMIREEQIRNYTYIDTEDNIKDLPKSAQVRESDYIEGEVRVTEKTIDYLERNLTRDILYEKAKEARLQKARTSLNKIAAKWRPKLEKIELEQSSLKNDLGMDFLAKYERQLKIYTDRCDTLKYDIDFFDKTLDKYSELREEYGEYLEADKKELAMLEAEISQLKSKYEKKVEVAKETKADIMLNLGLLDKLEKKDVKKDEKVTQHLAEKKDKKRKMMLYEADNKIEQDKQNNETKDKLFQKALEHEFNGID